MDLERLKALALAATPGPWSSKYVGTAYPVDMYVYKPEFLRQPGKSMVVARCAACVDTKDPPYRDNHDVHFIAAANPATVLKLIAEIERLRKYEPTQAKEAS
jgi:hypothetical protein